MNLLAVVSQRAVSMATGARGQVHRIRTELFDLVSGALSVDEHVRVGLPAQERWPVFGDVLVEHGVGARQAVRLAVSCPGALVVAVHHGRHCWIRLGSGDHVRELALELEVSGPGQPDECWEALASLAHSCLVAGLPATALSSAAVCHLRTQAPGSPCSSCRRRRLVASASSDRDRPTEA